MPSTDSHRVYLRDCLELARTSPPKPTNFRVGALLLSLPSETVLSTGFTLELPGNTHAEQSCLSKLAKQRGVEDTDTNLSKAFPPPKTNAIDKTMVLYCTMEPCAKRLSGNKSCVQRILETRAQGPGCGVQKVYFGVKEPGIFVGESEGCRMLSDAGVEWEFVPGLEEEILAVATAGHVKEGRESGEPGSNEPGTNLDKIPVEERQRQADIQRNPKKRIMEL